MTAAKELGQRPLRYVFGCYPTPDQAHVILAQAAMCRALQNALNCIHEARYLRKIADPQAYVPYLLVPGVLDDVDAHRAPTEAEMNRWVTALRQHDPRWQEMSTHTPRRVVKAVARSWEAFFRGLQRGNVAGKPKRKVVGRDVWLPHIHIKRAGDVGSAGSGCELRHVSGRNWSLALKGVPGEIHCRGKLPEHNLWLFNSLDVGRFIDVDIKLIAGKWKVSICAYVRRDRIAGTKQNVIEFGIIDGLAKINGLVVVPDGIAAAQSLQDAIDELKSYRDKRWPPPAGPKSLCDEEFRSTNNQISRLSRKAALIRHNALHVWTTRIIRESGSIKIILPSIKENTKSSRGNSSNWGAAVETVSALNRNTLSYAPSMAAQMLQYKAEEAGIPCEIVRCDSPEIGVGHDIAQHRKESRRARRSNMENEICLTR